MVEKPSHSQPKQRRRVGRCRGGLLLDQCIPGNAVLDGVHLNLTRPLGATVGDLLDKPIDHGGLALSRPLLVLPQRPGSHPGQPEMVQE